ncbi:MULTISPECIES: CBU_0585 family protein [Legionella]|uniref:Uncharacterized protein n=1 Tax=Legionella septentrionalis TaxID=2498109 RepID=A0A3S0XU84_9GAMM|nr:MULTISPECIES: CBU_0585 family protein [Legionella]MCP0914596.1 hypothetical protein [Legionella sp. 27cVA30]RUQ90052.1 hypothetical protein EKM59_02640 [Legionella septentrionalis]RUQ96178.1 hypothetical protein ELY11_08580 [Legionella septentrionalis]RUR09344.1 hypothetical protein ELY14_08830 [Legionella septentrionalis]RUR14294.1 hypothetical protein ELY10_09040 [Legionella septentrionalis]
MSSSDIDKAYISPIDRFLFEFDLTHQKSASQMREIEKYRRISALRDHAPVQKEGEEIWKDF